MYVYIYIYISLSLSYVETNHLAQGSAMGNGTLAILAGECAHPIQSVSVLFDHRVWFFEPHWEDSHRSHKEVPEDSNSSPLEIQEGRG